MLKKFIMPTTNTCAETGAVINAGDPVYAENMDQVRAGRGICEAAYLAENAPTPDVSTPESEFAAAMKSVQEQTGMTGEELIALLKQIALSNSQPRLPEEPEPLPMIIDPVVTVQPALDPHLDLDEMTVPELRDLAESRGIDLDGKRLKADIIAAITEAISGDSVNG
jgi:hypothetical protein